MASFWSTPTFTATATGRRGAFCAKRSKNGHDLLLDIDVQGAAQIKQNLTDAISIFVLPPDRQTLEWRLRNRSEDREEVIQRRLMTASREIAEYDKYDYVLINDKLEDSVRKVAGDCPFGTIATIANAATIRG